VRDDFEQIASLDSSENIHTSALRRESYCYL